MIFAQAEFLRQSLEKLEEFLENRPPLMNESTEKAVETVLNIGAKFAEVGSPICHREPTRR